MACVSLATCPFSLTVPLPSSYLRTGFANWSCGRTDGKILCGCSSDVRRSRESQYVPVSQAWRNFSIPTPPPASMFYTFSASSSLKWELSQHLCQRAVTRMQMQRRVHVWHVIKTLYMLAASFPHPAEMMVLAFFEAQLFRACVVLRFH